MVVMGIDGGNSKTYAVVVDERGNRLGAAVTGGGNHQNGLLEAMQNIRAAGEAAQLAAGMAAKDISFVQYGLAGADREKDFSILRPALSGLPWASWDVVCDTMEGLRTGSPSNVGVVVVCGSGTNCAGRNVDGKTVQTGGFTYLTGDAAGGGYLAIQTFRAAVRSWELREEPTSLREAVPAYLCYNNVEEMWNDYLDRDLQEAPLGLSVVVHQQAEMGDEVSIRILSEMGKELGLAANSVIERLGGFGDMTIPIVLTGSVVQKGRSEHLVSALQTELDRNGRCYEIVIPSIEPVYGAVLLAFDHLGIRTSKDIMERFSAYGGYEA